MGIITYRMELNEEHNPVLVKDAQNDYTIDCCNSPAKVVELCNDLVRLKYLAEENVIMIALDAKMSILGLFNVSHGALNYSVCNPREIFMRALIIGAGSIILLHNHPSGNSTPSEEDHICQKRLQEAGQLIGVRLCDSIIVGRDSYFSFKEEGYII